jgi:hypothetical protein
MKMDGVTGLQLLDTVKKISNDGFEVPLIIFGGTAFIIALIFLILGWDSDDRNKLIIATIISMIVLTTGIYIHNHIKPYNEYKCAITDENYHVDLDKYIVTSKKGKLITLEDKQ